MIVHELRSAPGSELAQALPRFEAQFRYPLGPGRDFRISHGEDYPRFFRAIGEAICFVAEQDGRVLGVLGAALCDLLLPNGERQPTVYLGDLKIDPAARGGWILLRLSQAAARWVQGRATTAFGVVMEGTAAQPSEYSGRLGIPLFRELARIAVLRLTTSGAVHAGDRTMETTVAVGDACFARLSLGRYATPGGFSAERSEVSPQWLMATDGRACGRLEDTRRAKRLFADNGAEMESAHLSCFAYDGIDAAAELIRVACGCAARLGFPALFVAVPATEAQAICRNLADMEIVTAHAIVYGAGLTPGVHWNIHTAEI